ncbi:MAG: NAD(P)H-hydrate dehydratase [Kiritimatiellia bacterium]
MKFIASETLRRVEARAIAKDNSLAQGMMERAGRGLARALHEIAVQMGRPAVPVRFLTGPGNNGGDAFAAALALRDLDQAAEVWLTCPREKLRGVAKIFFEALVQARIPWVEMVGERAWQRYAESTLSPPILVDALLGTGARGEPLGDIRRAVEYLNAKRLYSLVVSADVPTGLDADTGVPADCTVRADFTVTMCLPKAGMAAPAAQEYLGAVTLIPIGIPRDYVEDMTDARPDLQLVTVMDLRRSLPPRPRDAHKGTYGTALLLGGSARYPGAIVLAAEGAVRSGVGLVRVATVESAAAALVARVPEAIAEVRLGAEPALAGADAVLAGPGLGRGPEVVQLVEKLLRETPAPLVLDADAISALAGRPEAVRACAQPVVLTPHPGELARLLGTDVAAIQRDRLAAARAAAERTGAIVVLKGAGTLVAQSGQPTWINLTGNPGMACGGCGDVLAGLLAGLLAQGLPPLAAACAAVWLHGSAGDYAALRRTQPAMRAGDVAAALPDAFRYVSLR